jgi:hypothetical protein
VIDRCLVLFVLGTVVAAGCSSAASPSSAPTLAASPSASVGPTPTPVLSMTKTFTSVNNGFAVGYPADWTVEPATSLWWPPAWAHTDDYTGFDFIFAPADPHFRAASAVAPEGVLIDDWIDSYMTTAGDNTCNPRRSTLPEITIDGQAGRIRTTCPSEVEATVVVGRRAYMFTLSSESPDIRAIFDAFAATIDLRPEGAPVAPTPTPSPS